MDLYTTILEAIDLRSFSNLWYWIALAVMWSTVSHWVMGVPYDMLIRARRKGGEAEVDFEDMVRISVNRIELISEVSGSLMLVGGSAGLTALGVMGFWYRVEFAQAVFLLALPLSLVVIFSFHAAHQVRRKGLTGDALKDHLSRLRTKIQILGVISLVITAFWGMYQNLAVGALRGLG